MNMTYCRFQNTAQDLRDCAEHIDSEELSREESAARERLIRCAADMLEQLGISIDGHEVEQALRHIA